MSAILSSVFILLFLFIYQQAYQLLQSTNMNRAATESQQNIIGRIFRSSSRQNWSEKDMSFADHQLHRIYSEQLAQILNEKKFYFLCQKNRSDLDKKIDMQAHAKINKIATLQERSEERRTKLIKDRVKHYTQADKRWFQKKQHIKEKVKDSEKEMREVSKKYRLRSQDYWKEREFQQRTCMRQFSQKYHYLTTQVHSSRKAQTSSHQMFDTNRHQLLLAKRQSRFALRKSQNIDQALKHHQQKEELQSKLKEKEIFQKLVDKLSKIEHIEIKRDKERKKQEVQKSKAKLNQKIYCNNKPQIGQLCKKHDMRQSRFRAKTTHNQSPIKSIARSTMSRSNLINEESERHRLGESMMKYYQKSRKLKLVKMLKMKVRSQINSQFRSSQLEMKRQSG